jgi:putative transposase
MARRARIAPGGGVYHVLNRAAGKMHMLRREKDLLAFEGLIAEALQRHPMRLLAYCLMGTHWHFVAWPRQDGELSAFFRWLTHTHAMRWRVSHRTVGYGPLYQGRFKSFPVQPTAEHVRAVCRYVERNALAAGRVRRAEDWRFGSLWRREHPLEQEPAILSPWPEALPGDWTQRVNLPLTGGESARLALSLQRGCPFGDIAWSATTVRELGLEHTVRREGRPPKAKEKP